MSKPDLDIRSAVATLRAETRARLQTLRAEREAAREAFMARRRAAFDARMAPSAAADPVASDHTAATPGGEPLPAIMALGEGLADLSASGTAPPTMSVPEGGDDAVAMDCPVEMQAALDPVASPIADGTQDNGAGDDPDTVAPHVDEATAPTGAGDMAGSDDAASERKTRTDIKLRITAAVAAMTIAVPDPIIAVPAPAETPPTTDATDTPAMATVARHRDAIGGGTFTPLEDVAMLGPGLARRLEAMGITTAEALASTDLETLSAGFGRVGAFLNLQTLSEAAKAACHDGVDRAG